MSGIGAGRPPSAGSTLRTEFKVSRIGAGRRHSSVPAHLLGIPSERHEQRRVQSHREKEVAARADAAERRCGARGREMRVRLAHYREVRVAVKAGWRRHGAKKKQVEAPSCLLGRATRAARPAARRADGLEHRASASRAECTVNMDFLCAIVFRCPDAGRDDSGNEHGCAHVAK